MNEKVEPNHIYQGNCYDLIKLVEDKSIDLIITDPPYEISTTGAGIYKRADKRYVKELVDIKDGFNETILNEMCRVLKKINIYIWCSQKQIPNLIKYFVKEKGCNWNIICWHKTNPIPACGNKYLTDTEYCLFFREKGVKVYGSFETKKTYYLTPLNTKDKKKYNHPTIKPLDIIKNLVVNSTEMGGVVLDTFLGSGTTAKACQETGRRYIGFETNEEYYKTALERLNETTDIDDLIENL